MQLLPLIRNIDSLNQRVTYLESQFNNQQLIIVPKGELDARFDSINKQLDAIQLSLNRK